jgi:glycyl-tRNA synthetase
MPEVAEKLYRDVRARVGPAQYDAKQSIGKRYARMDEAGTPFCFTIDGDTLKDFTVTVRHRDTQAQERIGGGASWEEAVGKIAGWLGERLR